MIRHMSMETLESRRLLAIEFLADIHAQEQGSLYYAVEDPSVVETNHNVYVWGSTRENLGVLARVQGDSVVEVKSFPNRWGGDFTTVGDSLFFQTSPQNQSEFDLWVVDDVSSEATLLQTFETQPDRFAVGDGQLAFLVDDEFWTSDGTVEGTQSRVQTSLAEKSPLVWLDEAWYFIGAKGDELWRTNGTINGTKMVFDVLPDLSRNSIFTLLASNDRLVFSANDQIVGHEIWISDGSNEGTQLLQDIAPGRQSSVPRPIIQIGEQLFFQADDSIHGRELWVTGGTTGTTRLVANVAKDATHNNMRAFTAFQEEFIFVRAVEQQIQFWRSDGTAEGTSIFALLPKLNDDLRYDLIAVDEQLYFTTWASGMLDIFRGSFDLPFELIQSFASSPPTPGFAMLDQSLYFFADEPTGKYKDRQLWKIGNDELTSNMLTRVQNGSSFPRRFTTAGDRVFFTANDGVHGTELWSTDGTRSGTQIARDIVPGAPSTLFGFQSFEYVHDTLLFAVADETNGMGVWRSDGTQSGTHLLIDLEPGTAINDIHNRIHVANLDDQVLVFFTNNTGRIELWSTDSTVVGTTSHGIVGRGQINASVTHDGWVYFANQGQILRTDGANTETIGDYPPLSGLFVDVTDLILFNDQFYLISLHEHRRTSELMLWRFDDTWNQFEMIDRFVSNQRALGLLEYYVLGNHIFFAAEREGLWVTNGAEGGSIQLTNQRSARLTRSTDDGDKLYYRDLSRRQLWESDGTIEGTQPFSKKLPDGFTPTDHWPSYIASGLYFTAHDDDGNESFWVERQGDVSLIADGGPFISSELGELGEQVLFVYNSKEHNAGFELWMDRPNDVGDINRDSIRDASDIDAAHLAVRRGDEELDLNQDGSVDQEDIVCLVEKVFGSVYGDANLDGQFDSSDFVLIFQRGEYEDDIVGNSGWSDGDWNGDGEFDSSDFVIALRRGAYVP